MDFNEKTKNEVKERAGFRCCRCQLVGVHVHHILPIEYGGTNDIDNAAPLCPSCHDYYGGNPDKRKEIRHMRDWWYGRIEKQYPDNRQLNTLQELNDKVDQLQKKQIGLNDFKVVLNRFTQEAISNITLGTAVTTASGIANATVSPSPSPSPSFPSPEEIEAVGDQWIQSQIDIERGK